jgi:hypothetical protein
MAPSWESEAVARAAAQKSSDRSSAATSLSLASAALSAGSAAGGLPPMAAQVMRLSPWMWTINWPNVIWAGVGL